MDFLLNCDDAVLFNDVRLQFDKLDVGEGEKDGKREGGE